MKDILLWVLPNEGYDTVPTLKDHLAAFRREHPGLRVSVWVRTEASLWRRLFENLKDPALRPRPDVVQIPSHWTSTLAELRLLKDLGEIDPGLDLGAWTPALREHCRLADSPKVYSLPWWMDLRILYYRKEAMRRAGIDPERTLGTWEGFREACRALAKRWKPVSAAHYPVANPNPRDSVSMTDLAPFVWSRGGAFFSQDGTRSLFHREAACRGVGDYFDLLSSNWMPLRGQGGLPPKDLFDGACALQFSGRLPRRVRAKGAAGRAAGKAAEDIGAVPFPGEQRTTLLSAQNLAIMSHTESPRESYGLLRWLTDGPSAAEYPRTMGAFPATEGGLGRSLDEHPNVRGAFDRSLERARMLPNIRLLGTLERVFDRSMKRLVRETMLRAYSKEAMRQELIHAAAEMDHILSLYGHAS